MRRRTAAIRARTHSFAIAKRLGDDIVGAALQKPRALQLLGVAAEHDHRHVCRRTAPRIVAGAHCVEQRERVPVDVDEQKVDGNVAVLKLGDRRLLVSGWHDGVAVGGEVVGQERSDDLVGLGEQDPRGRGVVGSSEPPIDRPGGQREAHAVRRGVGAAGMGQRGGHFGDDMREQRLTARVVEPGRLVPAFSVTWSAWVAIALGERDLPDLIADLVGGVGDVDAQD